MPHRIEAQTLGSHPPLPLRTILEVAPVINKIHWPAADPKRVKQEIEYIIGIPAEDAPEISAKVGLNIHEVLERSYPISRHRPGLPDGTHGRALSLTASTTRSKANYCLYAPDGRSHNRV